MRLVVNGIWVALTALRCNIVAMAGSTEVSTQNLLAVKHDNDTVANHAYLLLAPLAQRPVLRALGCHQSVSRAVNLVIRQSLIDGRIMVQYLHLTHSVISSILAHWRTDAYTIVYTCLSETEIKAKDKVAILATCVEIMVVTILRRDLNNAVHGNIVAQIARPLGKVVTIKQQMESLTLLLAAKRIWPAGISSSNA